MKSVTVAGVAETWPTSRDELSAAHDLAGWDISRAVFDSRRDELIRECTDPRALRVAGFLTADPGLLAKVKKRHREIIKGYPYSS